MAIRNIKRDQQYITVTIIKIIINNNYERK